MKPIRIVKDAPELNSVPVMHDSAVLGVTIAGEIVVLGYVHQEAAPTSEQQPQQRKHRRTGLAGPVLADISETIVPPRLKEPPHE